ncbi:MAG: tautomerase family protein [Candidatus Thiodiazotropha sp.]|jgi:4-oxalocrotonate tautomerase
MPYIEVTIDPTPTPEQATKLAAGITEALQKETHKRPEVTAVRINSREALLWTINTAKLRQTTAYMEIKITQGTNSHEEKSSLIARLHQLLLDTLGELEPASYIVLHELPAENWGYAGLTQAHRTIQRGD